MVVLVGGPVSRSGRPEEETGASWSHLALFAGAQSENLASNEIFWPRSGRSRGGYLSFRAAVWSGAAATGATFSPGGMAFRRGYSRGPCGRARRHFRNLAGRTLERQALGHWRNLGSALALVADVRLWPGQKPGSLVRQNPDKSNSTWSGLRLLLVGSISRHERGRDAEVVGREMGRSASASCA